MLTNAGRAFKISSHFSLSYLSFQQLLDHLAESGIYTEGDLQPFGNRLAELRAIIKKDADQGKHPPQLTKLMMKKLEGCEKVLKTLQGTLSVLSVELVPIHQRLVSVRRQIAAASVKPKPARHEIKTLQEELRKIDSKRVDGKFLGPGGSSVPAGQAILVGILEDCFEIVHDINVRNDEVPMTLQPIYDRLNEIKSQLEHLVMTHRWTLRETDLWNYQVTLKEIDRLRVDGKFVDSEGKQPEGQLVLLYLLRRCYGLIYRLVASSEPISEELTPISNKLSTVSKCLKEVSKYGGPFTMRDLYPYRLALHQIDNMRTAVNDKDGNDTGVRKWLGRDGSIPEGQAILRAQYEEVEQMITEMLNREEDDDEEEEEDEGAEDEEWEGSEESSEEEQSSRNASDISLSLASPALAQVSYNNSPLSGGDQDSPAAAAGNVPPISMGFDVANAFRNESEKTPTIGSLNAPQSLSSSTTSTKPSAIPSGVANLAAIDQAIALPATGETLVIPGFSAKAAQPPLNTDNHSTQLSGASTSSNETASSPPIVPTSTIEALTANINDSLHVE